MGIGTKIASFAAKTQVKAVKAAPQIAVVTGVGLFVGCVVVASKETIAAKEIIDEAKDLMQACEESFTEEKVFVDKKDGETKPYTYDVYQHDMRTITIQTGLKLLNCYKWALIMGVGGATCIFWAFRTLNRALIGANLALQTLSTKYDRLYQFAVENHGEAKIKDIVDGVTVVRTEKVKNPETGKMEERNVYEVPKNIPSNWIVWGPGDAGWEKEESYRQAYLNKIQDYMTDSLYIRDVMWLSEVVDMFGKHALDEQEEEFRVTGWIGPKSKYFDPDVMDGVIKIEKRVLDDDRWLLTFNTDGCILPYLPKRKKRLDWGLGKKEA